MHTLILVAVYACALAMPGIRGQMIGGWNAVDISHPDVQQLLEDIYYPRLTVAADDMELVGAEIQVVSGLNYRMTFIVTATGEQCQAVIYRPPSRDATPMVTTDTCVGHVVICAPGRRDKRSSLGGYSPADVNDPTSQQLLEDIYYPSTRLEAEDLELIQLEKQVVAGTNYRYTFRLAASDQQCRVVIFFQPWTDRKEVMEDTCRPTPVLGGWREADVGNPKAQQLLDEVYFPSLLVGAEYLELVRVETQVVSGINYRMTFTVTGTDTTCQVVIYTQWWTGTRQVSSDTCKEAATASVPGGGWSGDV